MFNSFALPVAKPRVSNDKFSSPTKGGKIGISSRLYGDTISSSIKKKGLKSVQFKEEKASTPFVANSFRSNSAVGANRNNSGSEIGAGLMGNKGIPVGSIQLGPGLPRSRMNSFRNKENDAAATSAIAKAAAQ